MITLLPGASESVLRDPGVQARVLESDFNGNEGVTQWCSYV